jgi:predicted nucleic acid-binding protein
MPLSTTPNAVLRGLVHDGPVLVSPADEEDLAVFGSLIDHHTLHDALLIANHRVRGTEAIITNDEEFAGENTVWN